MNSFVAISLITLAILLLAGLFFLKNHSLKNSQQPDIGTTKLQDEYNEKYTSIMNRIDTNFDKSTDPSDWPIFKHPKNIYTIKYHPAFVPEVKQQSESPFESVEFVIKNTPLNTDQNINLPIVRIYFWGKGGGSWCTVECQDVNKDLTRFNINNAIDPIFEEKTDRIIIGQNQTKMYIGTFYNFIPYTNSRYEIVLFSKYDAINQREIIRKMYTTLVWDGELIEKITNSIK